MNYRIFFFVLLIFLNGCVSLSDKLIFTENSFERKEAFLSLDKISLEEAKYIARDLKEIFQSSGEKYKIRAAYSLLKISVIMVKNNYFNDAFDYCNFLLIYGITNSSDSVSKQIAPYFISNLPYILSISVSERKTNEWKTLNDFLNKNEDKYKIKVQEKQLFLIKEASALNLLDDAFKDGNIECIYDIINNYKETYTFKFVQKIMHILLIEKSKNKNLDVKNILISNNDIYNIYKKATFEIDNVINKSANSLIKK